MKRLKRYVALILVVALIFQVDIRIADAKEAETPQVQSVDKVRTIYNMLIPIRFKGESEYLNTSILEDDNITNMQLIDNTYNKSIYSVKEYYKAVSNQTVDIETVYLTPETENDQFASIELDKTRGYYSPKTEQNPEGYTTDAEYRRSELVRDWSKKVEEAINNGAKLKNIDGNVIDFDKLDSNDKGLIDSITLIFTPSDAKYASEWSSPLWAYQNYNGLLEIKTGKKTLTSNRYYQAPIQNDPVSLYKDGNDVIFSNTKTLIHEMGHMFGLLDLYSSTGGKDVVYFMSSMAKAISPVVQFMTSRERQAAGWLNNENITPITEAGTYTLQPTKDKRQDGTVAYTLELPNSRKLYLEYRYVDDSKVNRFDCNGGKRELYKYNTGADPAWVSAGNSGLNKSGLLACDVDTSKDFPSNNGSTPQLSVVDGSYDSKIDAPRGKGEEIDYGGYTIEVTELTKEEITFKVSGKAFGEENQPEQPGTEGKPSSNGVTLLAPSEVGNDLQMTAARGSEIQFIAQAEGKKNTYKDFAWNLQYKNDGTDDGTGINLETGLLKIGNFETPTSVLKVVGRYKKDDTKSITIDVKVVLANEEIPVTYSVTYLSGEYGIGTIESARKANNSKLSLSDALYTRTGYIQTGWSLSDGGEKAYDLKSTYDKNSSVILYPYWTKKTEANSTVKPSATPTPTTSPTVMPTVKPTATPTTPSGGTGGGAPSGPGIPSGGETGGGAPEVPKPTESVSPTPTVTPTESPNTTPTVMPTESASPTPSVPPTVTPTPTISPTPGIVLNASSIVLDTGASQRGKITAPVVGSDKKVLFKSSNSNIVKVDQNGNLTALKAGMVNITASAGGMKAICKVIVKTASVKLNTNSVVLYLPKMKSAKLNVKVSGASSKVTFRSKNTKVVKVDASGKLMAVKAGKTSVIATANGKTAVCKVEVKKTSLELNQIRGILYLNGKNSIQLRHVIVGPSKRVIYKSSNTNVLKVSSTGKVLAVGKGTAYVTVTANGIKKRCKITVL